MNLQKERQCPAGFMHTEDIKAAPGSRKKKNVPYRKLPRVLIDPRERSFIRFYEELLQRREAQCILPPWLVPKPPLPPLIDCVSSVSC